MNRVRKYNKVFQVLVSPHQKYNTGFEFLLGSWTDAGIMGFKVKEFTSLYDAECEAQEQPDINWEQLVDYHKDIFVDLRKKVYDLVKDSGMVVQIKNNLMTPDQAKNIMFERVLNNDNEFRTVYDMNDIISFTLINPWSANIHELERRFIRSNFNIFNSIKKNGIIMLVGRTDIGTTYEIILVPSVINNWLEWKKLNPHLSNAQHLNELKNCIKIQNLIDENKPLR